MASKTETAPQPGKIALCWFDVLLFVLVVACGLAFWSAAARYVEWHYQHERPVKEAFEHAASLPMRRAELSMAAKDLEKVQAKLLEVQMDQMRLSAEIDADAKNVAPNDDQIQQRKRLESQREQRVKLDASLAMAGALKREAGEKAERMRLANAAAIDARRAAEVAFKKASQRFELSNRLMKVGIGAAGWLVLLAGAWIACGAVRKRLHASHRSFVIGASIVVLVALCTYEIVK